MAAYFRETLGMRLLILICLAPLGVFSQFAIDGFRLEREGSAVILRGVVYSSAPIGSLQETSFVSAGCRYGRDFPLIASSGANAIRTLARVEPEDWAFRMALRDAGLYWLAGFPLEPYFDPTASLSPATAAGRALRQRILDDFADYVEAWREQPRLVAFVFGNSVSAGYGEKFSGAPVDFYSLLAEAAALATERSGGAVLVTSTVHDPLQLGSATFGTLDAQQPALAFWSVDAPGRADLQNVFAQVRQKTGKPFVISSFGIDAYDNRIQAENPSEHSLAAERLASQALAESRAAFRPLMGAFFDSFSDEWWRGGPDPNVHGVASTLASESPDGRYHPAWTGLFRPARSGVDGLDSLRPRGAYFALARAWGGQPLAEISLTSTPVIAPGGVVNLDGGSSIAVPGSLVSLRGENFSPAVREASSTSSPPFHLGGVSVCADGQPLPLLLADPEEIRAQVPWELPFGQARATVFRAGAASLPESFEVRPAAPVILPGGVFRPGLPCPVDEENGVPPGSYLEVYGSGLGASAILARTGVAAAAHSPLVTLPAAALNGEGVPVLYSGLIPGVVGVYQTNVHIGDDFAPGPAELRLSLDGAVSGPHQLRIVSSQEKPAVVLAAPVPGSVVLQEGGPAKTLFVDLRGRNGFCEIVRFQFWGLPPGVRAAIPVGLPGQRLLLTVWAEPGAPRAEDARVTLSAVSTLREASTAPFLVSVLPALGDVSLRAISGGWLSGAPVARFELEGRVLHDVSGGGPGRGFNFLTLNPYTGALGDVRTFDTWESEEAVEAMEQYLANLPEGTLVLGAVADDGALLITSHTRRTIREALGAQLIDLLGYQQSWAIISRKGAAAPIAERYMPNGRAVLETVVSFPLP